jgi:hypothetical protein
MTLEEQHAAHKERLVRMGALPARKFAVRRVAMPPATRQRDIINLYTVTHRGRTIYESPIIIRQPDPDTIHLTTITCRAIISATSAHYGVTVIDILSARRQAEIVRPRQVAMYLAKVLTLRSLPEIGRWFGGRDHTTVLHAARKIEALVDAPHHDLIDEIAAIKSLLGVEAEAVE